MRGWTYAHFQDTDKREEFVGTAETWRSDSDLKKPEIEVERLASDVRGARFRTQQSHIHDGLKNLVDACGGKVVLENLEQ
jgi:hypothetical protein